MWVHEQGGRVGTQRQNQIKPNQTKPLARRRTHQKDADADKDGGKGSAPDGGAVGKILLAADLVRDRVHTGDANQVDHDAKDEHGNQHELVCRRLLRKKKKKGGVCKKRGGRWNNVVE